MDHWISVFGNDRMVCGDLLLRSRICGTAAERDDYSGEAEVSEWNCNCAFDQGASWDEKSKTMIARERRKAGDEYSDDEEEVQGLLQGSSAQREEHDLRPSLDHGVKEPAQELEDDGDWRSKIRLLLISFGGSALYTVVSYFIPQLHDIPVFGPPVGAKLALDSQPFPSICWIVWISLAIMLADSLVSLGWLLLRPLVTIGKAYYPMAKNTFQSHTWKELLTFNIALNQQYTQLDDGTSADPLTALKQQLAEGAEPDAPPEHLVSTAPPLSAHRISGSLCHCCPCLLPGLIPFRLTLLSLVLALFLSIMGVRALGETDLNPVSGISKLTQLVFALVTPTTGPGAKNAVIINLVAGAISESAALQAGDLLQDLKCGTLAWCSTKCAILGQMIGSAVGAVLSAVVYKLYTHVYTIPGGLFEVPDWLCLGVYCAIGHRHRFAAHGQGMGKWSGRHLCRWHDDPGLGNNRKQRGLRGGGSTLFPVGSPLLGMYNTPSFTLARTMGGLLSLWWRRWKGRSETPIIVLASGLILGEGLFSIVNLLLASLDVPHL
ncbi:oligopeptide transporter [Pyrenophora tritici-repentis]|nr:oligopeptide transporter [Pyrenophora tritici-repentis]